MESSDKDDIGSLIAALTEGMSLTAEGSNKAESDMEARADEQEPKISQEEIETRKMSNEVFMDAKEAQNMDVEDVSGGEKPAESQEHFESNGTPTHFRLYDLPQEIRDGIFDLAYSTIPSDAQLVNKYSWDMEECWNSLEDDSHRPREFEYRISEFLVSKRFFVDAAQAFARNQTCTSTVIEGILSAYCTNFDIEFMDVYALSRSPNARHVRIRVGPRDFGSGTTRLVTRAVLKIAQIVNSAIYKDLQSRSGLVSLGMEAAGDVRMDTPHGNARSATWQANLKKLEKLLQSTALQPSVFEEYAMEKAREALAQGAPMRLYPSSNVLFDRPQLADTFADIPEQWACGSPLVELVCGDAKNEGHSLVGEQGSPADGNKNWPTVDDRDLGCMLMSGERPPKALVQNLLDKDHDTVIQVLKDKASSNQAFASEENDIPDTDEGLLEMMYTDPAAMLAWIREAKAKKSELVQLQASVSSVSGILNGLKLS